MMGWREYLQGHSVLLNEQGQGSGPAGRIVHIIIDGISNRFFDEALMPACSELAASGTRYRSCRTIWPSLTGPAHTAINSGTPPAFNGVRVNILPERKQPVVNPLKESRADSIAEILGAKGLRTAGICGQMNRGLQYYVSEAYAGHDAVRITDEAIVALKRFDPDYLQVVYFTVDTIEHHYGPESIEALEAASWVDQQLSRLLEHLDLSKDTLILCADHGQVPCRKRADELDEFLRTNSIPFVPYGRFLLIEEDLERTGIEQIRALIEVETVLERGQVPSCFDQRVAVILKEGYSLYGDNDVHYGYNHGGLADEELFVPLFICGGGIKQAVVDTEVSVLDIAPTICRLAGIKVPEQMSGNALGTDSL